MGRKCNPTPNANGFYNTGGKYKTRVGGNKTKSCQLWENMQTRACNKSFHARQQTYADVSVCTEWLDFQNFARWFDAQLMARRYVDGWHLDKDVLSVGDKIYSPETCCFLPQQLNNIVVNTTAKRGEFPLGVSFNACVGRYDAHVVAWDGSTLARAMFDCPYAAHEFYKVNKEAYVRGIVDRFKDNLAEDVYQFFKNYVVGVHYR